MYYSPSIFVSKTYSIEDCVKYWDTLPNADQDVQYSLPSRFKLEFTIFSPNLTQSPSVAFLRFNSSNGGFVGKGSNSSGTIYFFGTTFSTISANTDYEYSLSYENGSVTLTDGTTTKTSSQTLTSIYRISSWDNAKLKNIKIKPL